MKGNFHAPFWSSGRQSDLPTDCTGTRPKIAQRIKRVPSLQRYPEIILSDVYEVGRNEAGKAVDLELLPIECPWSVTELLGADFFPHSDEA